MLISDLHKGIWEVMKCVGDSLHLGLTCDRAMPSPTSYNLGTVSKLEGTRLLIVSNYLTLDRDGTAK